MSALRFGFIGAGNMAEAIIKGILRAKTCRSDQIIATTPRPERRAELHNRHGIKTVAVNADAAEVDVVVLGCKPQIMPEVVNQCAEHFRADALIISLAAGINLSTYQTWLGGNRALVRTMPNLPVTVFEGVTVYSCAPAVTENQKHIVSALFESVGTTYELDESLLDNITAFTGSGPAFVFRFVECFAQAADELGLPSHLVAPMAVQTLLGSAKLLAESGETAATLRQRVCSPKGTAEAGLQAMSQAGLEQAINAGLRRASQRAAELGQQANEKK